MRRREVYSPDSINFAADAVWYWKPTRRPPAAEPLQSGDIIMTGTPAGVAAVSPGDKIECGVDGVGTLKVTIGKPE